MIFSKKTNDEHSTLDDVITDVYDQMSGIKKDTEEFATLMAHLKELHALKKQTASHSSVSADKWVDVGGNLIGIFAILSYEHAHVITSKALSFIRK